jgi:hypothetical protein
MKRLRNLTLVLLLGCSAPLLIWVGAGVALYQKRRAASSLKQALSGASCSIDADCPPGYICLNGRCVPQKSIA